MPASRVAGGAIRPLLSSRRRSWLHARPDLRPHAPARPDRAGRAAREDPRRRRGDDHAPAATIVSKHDWGTRTHGLRDPPQDRRRVPPAPVPRPARRCSTSLERTLRITDGVVRFRIIKLAPGHRPPPPEPRRPSRPRRPPRPRPPPSRVAPRAPPTRRSARRSAATISSAAFRACATALQRPSGRLRRAREPPDPGLDSPTVVRRSPKGATAMAATNINRVDHHRQPDRRSRAALAAERHVGLQAARRRATRAARTARPASGSTSPTTSTSPSGARRARTAPATSPRAAASRSTAASSGASGRTGRQQAPGRRHHRRLRAVPRRPRRRRRRRRQRLHAALRRPGRHERLRRGAGRRRPGVAGDDDIPF